MENEKEKAVSMYLESRREDAQKAFQAQVNAILSDISELSRRLKEAKGRLLKLEYNEPEPLDIPDSG